MFGFRNKILELVKECFGGGVTTGSFAPAVTNTIYPRPGKKKKSKFRKKVEDAVFEISPEQYQQYLNDLYSSDDDDDSEKTWIRPTPADYERLRQTQNELDSKNEKEKRARLDKYKTRNDKYKEKVDQVVELWGQMPDVDIILLDKWRTNALNKIQKAEEDRLYYEKMPANELKKIKQIKMYPISINFDCWRVKRNNTEEN